MRIAKAKYTIILFFLPVVFSTVLAESQLAGNFKNPIAVQEVLTGKRAVANAAWWGFDKNDSTSALQGAINSGASKVIVPYMGSDWIVRPIKLSSNQEIIFEPGVVVAAKEGEFQGKRDCLFQAVGKKKISLKGYHVTLKMRKNDYMSSKYTKAEWRHVILLRASSDVSISGFTLADSGGDGICIGASKGVIRIPCRNILIEDCIFDNNYRQGISVGSVDKLRIENCILRNTRGTPPQAGIDLEPDHSSHRLSNVVVSNCISENNRGAGFAINISNLDAKSPEISVLFVNCYVRDCYGGGLAVFAGREKYNPKGLIEFRNCFSENTHYPGIHVGSKTTSPDLRVRFSNCTVKNSNSTSIRLNLRRTKDATNKIEFDNCYVYHNKNWSFMRIKDTVAGQGPYDITGDITVYNPYGAKIAFETSEPQELDLKVNSFKTLK